MPDGDSTKSRSSGPAGLFTSFPVKLDSLPNECMMEILRNLGLQDLLACLRVSRKVRALSIDRMKWLKLSTVVVSPVYCKYESSSSYSSNESEEEEAPEGFARLQKNISCDRERGATKVKFTVCFSDSITNPCVPAVEKLLERMWRTVFMLLRRCDTKATHFSISLRDVCGVLAKHLTESAHCKPMPEPILVSKLTATVDVANTLNTMPESLIYDKYQGFKTSVFHTVISHLVPKGSLSTVPIWIKCHEGALTECNLWALPACARLDAPYHNEPMWTVDALLKLIKTWQNGRQFGCLRFNNYVVAEGQSFDSHRLLPPKVFKELTDAGDSRFQCTFEDDPVECVISCVNYGSNQTLDVRFLYGNGWYGGGGRSYRLQSVCLVNKTST